MVDLIIVVYIFLVEKKLLSKNIVLNNSTYYSSYIYTCDYLSIIFLLLYSNSVCIDLQNFCQI